MKFHEAIDMILDGGEAYNDFDPSISYYFHKRGFNLIFSEIQKDVLLRNKDYDYGMEATLTAKNIKANWIVEKDGVVYDDPTLLGQLYSSSKALHEAINKCGQDFVKTHAEKQEKEIKMPLNEKYNGEIHVSCPGCKDGLVDLRHTVDEDWLEKKMLCFYRKNTFINPMNNTHYSPLIRQDNCRNKDCPFCFPQEQPKSDYIPDPERKVCYACGAVMQKTNTVTLAVPPRRICVCPECDSEISCKENDYSEDAREKVTVEEIMKQVDAYYDALSHYHYVLGSGNNMLITERETLLRLNKHYLEREIKHLVSLQGKVK